MLHKELRVTNVAIERPDLRLVTDEDGSNLSRATAHRKRQPPEPSEPKPKKAKTSAEGWVIQLDRFDLNQGRISVAATKDDETTDQLRLVDVSVFAGLRFATGNGSLKLTLRLSADSQLTPTGRQRLQAQLDRHGDVYRIDADGELLGGVLKAHATVDGQRLDNADGLVAVAIPRQKLAGYQWGPVRVDATAHPQTPPKLDVLVAIPGVELTAKDRGPKVFGLEGRLELTDLGLTARALQALTGSPIGPMAGAGRLEFALSKASAGTAPGLDAQMSGSFGRLVFGDTVLSRAPAGRQAPRQGRHRLCRPVGARARRRQPGGTAR